MKFEVICFVIVMLFLKPTPSGLYCTVELAFEKRLLLLGMSDLSLDGEMSFVLAMKLYRF